MLIDINSEAGRRQSNEFIDRQMAIIENSFEKRIKQKLNSMFIAAANFIAMSVLHFDPAIDSKTAGLAQILLFGYRRAYKVFGDLIFKEVEEKDKYYLGYETKQVRGIYDAVMEEWSQDTALLRATTISITTKKAVTKVLIKGISEGLSYAQIAKKVKQTGNVSTLWKAKRIVRTEMHTVAMKSLDEAVKITKSAREKEWITAGDERVRRLHVMADGERVFIDDFFTATGEALMYPGDERGSGDNIISCRCNMMFHS